MTWPSLARRVPRWGHDPGSRVVHGPARPGPHVVVPERESLELLRAAGLPVIASVAIEGRDASAMAAEAASVADRLGWPVAVKLDAPGLAHKSDAGGVVLDVRNRKQLESALRRVLAAGRDHEPDGVLIQPMAPAGVELIVGARRDPQFGPMVMVGIGGLFAEVLDDVVLRLAPIDASHARQMLDELRGARLLDGVRGRRGVDRSAVGEVIAALGRAMGANPTWREVDLNPVIAGPRPHGAVAVDALIVTDVRDPDWDYEDPGGGADV